MLLICLLNNPVNIIQFVYSSQERTDISGDLHIERLFLFATIWVFGGLLVYDLDKKEFNSLLLSLTNA